MIVSSDSNLEDTPPDGESPRQDDKLPKYCGVDKWLSRQLHTLEIAGSNPASRNQMPQ